MSVGGHWLALLGYAAQLFGDFAGYSLMAIGVARGLGVRLEPNFNRPFLARNLMDFWRRWHTSPNTWRFDYLYAPLTTSRGFFRLVTLVPFRLPSMDAALSFGAGLFVSSGLVFWPELSLLSGVAVGSSLALLVVFHLAPTPPFEGLTRRMRSANDARALSSPVRYAPRLSTMPASTALSASRAALLFSGSSSAMSFAG